MNDPFQSALISYLAGIDASLKTIAAYAQHRLTQETGVKEVRVTAYVRGQNAGGQMLHLYTDHPAVLKRVGRIYEEHFALVPFDPTVGKLYEGEAAPSRDWAEKSGHLVHVAPFTALFAPTGKTTDSGQPTYKFQRVLSLESAPVVPDRHPSHPIDPPPAPSITGDPLACPNCRRDWRHYNPACPDHRNPQALPSSTAPTPIPSSSQPVKPTPTARILRGRDQLPPLPPDTLRAWIQQTIADYTAQHRTATPTQTGHTHQALASVLPDEPDRRRFQEWLIGYPSMKEWSSAQILALHAWLKPSATNGPTDPHAHEEIALALDYLRDYAPHPVWATAQDAIDWAFNQGGFPDPATASAAYTARWIEWGRPLLEAMLARWADHIGS